MFVDPKCYVDREYFKEDPQIFEDAVSVFYMSKFCGYAAEEIPRIQASKKITGDIVKDARERDCTVVLGFLYGKALAAVDKGEAANIDEAMQTGICYYQNYVQISRWRKSKQVYSFDADILNELVKTDISKLSLPYDIFAHLPNRSLYLDFTANRTLTDEIKADGCLIQVQAVTLTEDNNDQYCIILMSFLKNNETNLMTAMVFPNEKDGTEIKANELYKNSLGVFVHSADETDGSKHALRSLLILQSLLYLCSYEPDIHETPASKMQYRKAKQNKKKSKTDMPVREYKVGERFGTAFRKWTKGQLGQSDEHTSTGRRNKPHIRKAHWHRHWIGKRGSEERELVVRWHYECFCGLTEKEAEDKLDTVKHSVS